MTEHACPVCGTAWSPQEAERAARRLLERLADEVNAATQTPAAGVDGPEGPLDEAPAAGPDMAEVRHG